MQLLPLEWLPILRSKSRLDRKILANRRVLNRQVEAEADRRWRSPRMAQFRWPSSSLMAKLGYQSRSVGRFSRTIESSNSLRFVQSNELRWTDNPLATWPISHYWQNSTEKRASSRLI